MSSWSGHFGDYDGDGLMDLVVTGDYFATGRNTRLYHNEGEGRFTAVTSGPWEAMTDRVGYGAWADTDNDGDLDLLLSVHETQTPFYLCNQGGGEFTRLPLDPNWFQPPVSLQGQAATPAWGTWITTAGWMASCKGRALSPFRNLGNGQFTVLTNTPMYRLSDWAQSYQLVDYDNDGDLDVFLPLEASPARLYRNDGQLRFTDVSTAVLKGRVPMGAGGSWADFDNDGDLDLISAGRDPHSGVFLVNNGDGTFAHWQGSPAALATAGGNWGIPTWGDYDNDGWLDLFMLAPGRLFHNLGDGNFEEITTGSPVRDTGSTTKSAAWADYDNNGTLDLFVAKLNSSGNLLYQNNGNGRHWLKIRLKGTASNSHGIGARITVQATLGGKSVRQRRDISAGTVIQELEAHFGLGDATVAELVRIEWPSGNVQELRDQKVDRVLMVTESLRIRPPRPSASLGGSVTLTNALGAGTYQWQFNGVDLAGETKRTLTLTNLQAAQQGRYSLVVTAADDTRTATNHAYLTIDTQFTKITDGAAATERGCSWISSCGDYDNDGNPDLAVLRYPASQSAVYRNNGDGTFTTVPDIPWNTGQGYSWGLWGDFDNDGHQDFVSQRADQPASVYFGDGHGTFTARQLQLGESWSIAVADYDQDGFLDLYGSYSGHLLRNNGDRTFTRMTTQAACRLPTARMWGGALWADYDDDGALDLFCADADDQGSSYLYHNNGQGASPRSPSHPPGGRSPVPGATMTTMDAWTSARRPLSASATSIAISAKVSSNQPRPA
ncbi:MAG: FG-GAP-like repeat-containing protein [Verrucomicrobia bacterium]|nr:FG-GAP-like repeat-containing protein [Verrucomicrobiota bacterium]